MGRRRATAREKQDAAAGRVNFTGDAWRQGLRRCTTAAHAAGFHAGGPNIFIWPPGLIANINRDPIIYI